MANESLFGDNPEMIQQALNQRQQAQSMAYGATMGPQGNPFYVPGIAAGMNQGGAMLGNAVGGMMGSVPPQIAEAYKMQEIQKETDKAGIDFGQDPVGYMKVAASNLLKAGMHDKALQVMQQADQMATSESNMGYKSAMGNQANADAKVKIDTLDEKQALMQAQTELAQAKGAKAKIDGEVAQLIEARKQAREPSEIALIDAKIKNLGMVGQAALTAAAKKIGSMSKESANQAITRLINEDYASGAITREEAQRKLTMVAVNPMQALIGDMMVKGMGGDSPVVPNPRVQAPAPQAQAPSVSPGTTVQKASAQDMAQLKQMADKLGQPLDFKNYEYGIKDGKLLRKRK